MIKKEENKKEKKEVKKVVKKIVKKSSDKVAKKVVNPVRDSPFLENVISNGVKKSPIVKKVVAEVVKKSSKVAKEKTVKIPVEKDSKLVTKEPTKRKKTEKTEEKEKVVEQKDTKKYYKGIGRRKRAVASVRLFLQGDKIFTINNKPANIYFNNVEYQKIIYDSLEQVGVTNKFKIQVLVRGGGLHAQAEAVRHGISRALLDFDNDENLHLREKLKIRGFLTRDPRRRERKKPGLKRARKATQWRKR